jgi:hypothetical protein
MTSSWPSLALVMAMAVPSHLPAQQVWELGGQALVTTSDPALVTGGLYAALRPSARARIAATLGTGVSGGRVAARGELLAHFLLSPGATGRPGAYAGGGVAGIVGRVDEGYVVVLLGLESAPGARSGWAVEAGVGGGVRLTAGWRWRWRASRGRK